MTAIFALIDAIPGKAYGHTLLSPVVRDSHKMLLQRRFDEGFMMPYRRLVGEYF